MHSSPRALPLRSSRLCNHPLAAALMAAGLLVSAHAAETPQRAPTAATDIRTYDIAPAPLAQALNRYAAEAGVVLAFDAAQLAGLTSRRLTGRFDVPGGFAALLAGTPLEAVPSSSGGYLVRSRVQPAAPAPAPDLAVDKALSPSPAGVLPLVSIVGTQPANVNTLDRTLLRGLATLNGDFTSQLKLNPHVQFDESQLSSATGGEIAPAEISIHGAKPYQNEILLDGMSLMNDLDPGNKITPTRVDMVPGASQAQAIDSSLLCEVTVRDSNVSAEFGRFTGGVVDAKLCSARKRLGGSVAMGYTSSAWTHVFIDPARREAFEDSSTADLQPNYRKRNYRATVEARPTADWGLLVSAARRTSDIPLRAFTTANDGTSAPREITQTRTQDMLMAKADYTPAGGTHKGDLTLVYAPSNNTYFKEDYRDSEYTIRTGGLSLSGRWESAYDNLRLTQQLTHSRNEQSRRSDTDYYRSWRWSTDKNWGDPSVSNAASGEGSWGDVDQFLATTGYSLKATLRPLQLAAATNRVTTGFELRRQNADYERLSVNRYYSTVRDLPTTGAMSRCQFADGSLDSEACSATPTINKTVGQYFGRLQTYTTGRFEAQAESGALFVEDNIGWQPFSLRVGLRADSDTLTKKTNLAPRTQLNWLPTEAVALDVGLSRYYGRNLFAYVLQEKINTLQTTQTRTGTLTWGTATQAKPLNRLESLKTPHDDEVSTGLTLEPAWLGGALSLRFTHREGKDQVVKRLVTKQTDCNGNQCYIYTNDGRSTTKDWALSWASAAAAKTGPVVTRTWVAISKSDVRANAAGYEDPFGSTQLEDAIIQYDGRFMRYSERPADNYNRPWTLRIGAVSTVPSRQLTVTNLLRLRGAYQQVLRSGTTTYEGATVDVYARTPLPRAFGIDTVILWEPRIRADQRLSLKLTIENLTNHRNTMTVSNTFASYERGRSVAVEAGVDF
ncbi:TonB-dependent receptor [Roseateles sp. BYS96W]|uniref:Secretin/TonB short N-terminal domain-containing protein n=1 Tax=Pelomonas nitida TaxID=3299027 RepID=A0ABW7GA08_9BURK